MEQSSVKYWSCVPHNSMHWWVLASLCQHLTYNRRMNDEWLHSVHLKFNMYLYFKIKWHRGSNHTYWNTFAYPHLVEWATENTKTKKKTSGTQSVPSIKMKIKKNEAKNVARTKTKIDLLLSTNCIYKHSVTHNSR